jgi:hypothetical protein
LSYFVRRFHGFSPRCEAGLSAHRQTRCGPVVPGRRRPMRMRLDRGEHPPSLPGLERDLQREQHPGHRPDRSADASRTRRSSFEEKLSHPTQACRVTSTSPRFSRGRCQCRFAARRSDCLGAQPAPRRIRGCRPCGRSAHPSLLVLQGVPRSVRPLRRHPIHALPTSRGEYRGRRSQRRRRPNHLHRSPA